VRHQFVIWLLTAQSIIEYSVLSRGGCAHHGCHPAAASSMSDKKERQITMCSCAGMRQTRDPIEHVKTLLKEHEWADATQLKKFDKKVRAGSCMRNVRLVLNGCTLRSVGPIRRLEAVYNNRVQHAICGPPTQGSMTWNALRLRSSFQSSAPLQTLSPHPLQIRADVNAEVEEAKKGEWPPTEFLWKNTYKDGLGSKMRPMEIGQEKIPV